MVNLRDVLNYLMTCVRDALTSRKTQIILDNTSHTVLPNTFFQAQDEQCELDLDNYLDTVIQFTSCCYRFHETCLRVHIRASFRSSTSRCPKCQIKLFPNDIGTELLHAEIKETVAAIGAIAFLAYVAVAVFAAAVEWAE